MSLNVSTHTSTRWVLGSLSLITSAIVLLSMLQPWLGLALLLILVFSGIQDGKGQTGWIRQWIAKSSGNISTDWKDFEVDKTVESLTVHVIMSTKHHWWVQRAWLLIGCTGIAWIAILMNWTVVVFTGLGALWLLSAFGHKDMDTIQPVQIDGRIDNGVVVHLPTELSWQGLQTWLVHHQTVLPNKGLIQLHCEASSIPCTLPNGFDGWSVEYHNQTTS